MKYQTMRWISNKPKITVTLFASGLESVAFEINFFDFLINVRGLNFHYDY